MSQLVVDASLTLSWLLPDEMTERSEDAYVELLKADTVWAPQHWPLEVFNALRMAERRERLDLRGVNRAVALLAQLRVAIDPESSLKTGQDALALAREHRISVYDAAYLELAIRRVSTLGTFDAALRSAASSAGIQLVPA